MYQCDLPSQLEAAHDAVRHTGWYRRHGVLVQDLVPPQGYDLRIVVVAGRVVGAVYRVAARGEWRTNIALGGVRRPVLEPRARPPRSRSRPRKPPASRSPESTCSRTAAEGGWSRN